MTDAKPDTDGPQNFPIQPLPKAALQAIYHAVTGKTETFSRTLEGNVIFDTLEVERLHTQILQQLEHYELVAPPTITLVVKLENSQKIQYSSWERFRSFQTNTLDITSEFIFKYEFLVQIPNTAAPQRCTVNISLDSALPVVAKDFENPFGDSLIFFLPPPHKWRAVSVSIDFVDFLVARVFFSVIEDWFKSLRKTSTPPWASWCQSNFAAIGNLWRHFGDISVAIFFLIFASSSEDQITAKDAIFALSFAVFLWIFFRVFFSWIYRSFQKHVIQNLIPAVIVLTEGDRRGMTTISQPKSGVLNNTFKLSLAGIMGICLNLVASYLYAYLTR